jgi:hypothetical protein
MGFAESAYGIGVGIGDLGIEYPACRGVCYQGTVMFLRLTETNANIGFISLRGGSSRRLISSEQVINGFILWSSLQA